MFQPDARFLFSLHVNVTTGRLATSSLLPSTLGFLHLPPLAEVDGEVKCYASAFHGSRRKETSPRDGEHL